MINRICMCAIRVACRKDRANCVFPTVVFLSDACDNCFSSFQEHIAICDGKKVVVYEIVLESSLIRPLGRIL